MVHNVFVYGKLRVCGRGFSEGKSEAGKQANNFVLAKTSNFLYTVLCNVFYFKIVRLLLKERQLVLLLIQCKIYIFRVFYHFRNMNKPFVHSVKSFSMSKGNSQLLVPKNLPRLKKHILR